MARKATDGLSYFPLDIDFYDDPKILKIEEKHGLAGSSVANRLLCSIYRNGYYIQWKDDDALVFARKVGNNISRELVQAIVIALIDGEFLHRGMYESKGILTSAGIQRRWLKIITDCNRKASIKSDFNLIKSEGKAIKSHRKGLKSEGKTQRKEKKKKESLYTKIGEGLIFISIRPVYANEKWTRVFELDKYFESTGQLEMLVKSGLTAFKDFIISNPGREFKDADYLYSSFKKFCLEGAVVKLVPPAQNKASPFDEAAFNRTQWTEEAWKKTYAHQIQNNPEFRKHFGL